MDNNGGSVNLHVIADRLANYWPLSAIKIKLANSISQREDKLDMNRKIYKKLAKKFGVTVDEVKRDMQEAVNATYMKPSSSAQNMMKNETVPTVDEFINIVAGQIENERQEEEAATEYEQLISLIDAPLIQLILDLWMSVGNNIFKEKGSLTEFKNKESEKLYEYNFGLGSFLRNNILTEESEIYKKFQENGIQARDDMSSAIIRTWHTALQQEQ